MANLTLPDSLLQETYTKAELKRRVQLAREYYENEYFVEQADRSGEQVVEAWTKELKGEFRPGNLYQFFEQLAEEVERLPEIKIYLAFTPGPPQIKRIVTWLRANVDARILADFKINPRLWAGCGLAWRGVYRNFSLAVQLQARRAEIIAILDQHAQSQSD